MLYGHVISKEPRAVGCLGSLIIRYSRLTQPVRVCPNGALVHRSHIQIHSRCKSLLAASRMFLVHCSLLLGMASKAPAPNLDWLPIGSPGFSPANRHQICVFCPFALIVCMYICVQIVNLSFVILAYKIN